MYAYRLTGSPFVLGESGERAACEKGMKKKIREILRERLSFFFYFPWHQREGKCKYLNGSKR